MSAAMGGVYTPRGLSAWPGQAKRLGPPHLWLSICFVSPPTVEMPQQEPARGQNKRSRRGCLCCLQSKVKCDERHPVCSRCDRTKKSCAWPEARPSLRARRRGPGPYKSRTIKTLPPIVPLSQSPESEVGDPGVTTVTLVPSYCPRGLPLRPSEPCDSSTLGNIVDFETLLPIEEDSHCNYFSSYEYHQFLNQTSFIPPSLQVSQIPSSSSLTITKWEWEALQFFERVFATIYSPKPFRWSLCAIISRYGKNHGTIQHLIIAVCLGQLDQTLQNEGLLALGKRHYQAGAQLVLQEMHQQRSDHCKTFVAFWLIQATYNIYWGDKAAINMAKLSQGMAQYTRKNQLLDLFNRSSSVGHSQELSTSTRPERGLLARLMIFTFYEDIDADFCHAGGSFATEVCTNNAIRGVYVAGRNFFSEYFEAEYPQNELIDDIQRSNILDLHFEANMVLSKINLASRENASQESFEEMAQNLEDLKAQHSAIFRSARIEFHEYNKVLSCANNVVAHFFAVETYNLQCLHAHGNHLLYTARLDTAIRNLLQTIGNLCREYPRNMPYRNQWLFFMAGIGTADPIHIAWILSMLKQGRYFKTLQRTMEIQRSTKVQMSINDVRSLFWGLGDEPFEMDRLNS
ncbi:hypothetical protein BP6252_10769 [Coleophoma cylindrospora]|uniref:Zn(2)-C6 fungal-type domain-containing protein n=1 Tax=Coleophoma cylindrospora TaxID=1849047 RepID=A0A3D8QTW1_9HELO|nr:hypothetical protein BP6252_10769 [Coleophoma cylindrospora]